VVDGMVVCKNLEINYLFSENDKLIAVHLVSKRPIPVKNGDM